MANTNFPLQSSRARRIKGFDKNIDQLFLCINASNLNISLLNVISQKMVSPPKVSHSFIEDCFFCYGDDTGVVAHEENSLKDHSKISHGVHNSRDLEASATYSTSVVDYATEDYFLEDQQTREDLRKWQVS
jgi:hypothetical protein